MQLIKSTQDHQALMMSWFTDQESISIWGGPDFHYPFTPETFKADTKFEELNSYSLIDDANCLLAFGQYYLRVGRCHLGRLVVSPLHRGNGFGVQLIKALSELGLKDYGVNTYSLFVLERNVRALKLYQKLGFEVATYPEQIPIDNCLYMVKSAE